MNPTVLLSPSSTDSSFLGDYTIAVRGKAPQPVVVPAKLDSPLVLILEPYIGEYALFIQLQITAPVRVVAYPIHTEADAYPTPQFIGRLENLPSHSFLVLIEEASYYTCLLCLSHADQKVQLNPLDDHTILLRTVSGTSRCASHKRPALICVKGTDPYAVLKLATTLALHLAHTLGKPFHDKSILPPWLQTLGWSSRLLCGSTPSHDSVVGAVESLQQEGMVPHYVLIEEGWQDLVTNPKERLLRPSLVSFNADKKRFPSGLKGLVDSLHQLGVKQVGVWHAIMGARHGVHPDVARLYDLSQDNHGRFFMGCDLGPTFEFFCDYYSYLREQGISFVQVGDQLSIQSYCRSDMDLTRLHQNLQIALQGAASIHFNIAHFNTDCLRNENLFYWATSGIARAAENIDPANPVGVRRAIRNNLCNALWLQTLMLPDFDTWRTDADPNDLLATFHALSGSLLKIGDAPGKTLKTTLQKMLLPSGKLVRADKPLTLCRDSIFTNPLEDRQVYKAFTHKGNAGVIAAFNLCSGRHTLHGTVSSQNVEGLKGERFAVFSHLHGFIAVVAAGEPVAITLKPRQCDVFIFAPVIDGVAVLGCHSLFLPPGPITEVVIEDDSVHISSLIAAPLLLYCERQVLEVRCNGHVLPWGHDARRHLLSLDVRSHIEEAPAIYSITFEA